MKTCYGRWFLASALVLALAMPALAIDGLIRVSQAGGGVQIWFEAEDYDERDPDDDSHYAVLPKDGAFGLRGEAVNRIAGGGRLRYDFDIDLAEGVGGTWYMWGRVINPSNHSDYMLIEDDFDDEEIPDFAPYPAGDGAAPFVNGDDRVFEGNVGPDWGWFGGEEGHIKELRDGENSMFMYHRQGSTQVFWDVFMWTDDPLYVPTDEDYENADIIGELQCDAADTHCNGLTIEGPEEDTAGTYTVTVDASDENDDEIIYVLTADNGVDEPKSVTSIGDNVLSVHLEAGMWTISVTVDDHRLCDDEAADNTCSRGPFEVSAAEGKNPVAPFRISDYGGGVQIWFEAEDFSERIPDDDTFFPVVPGGGLNGRVLSRAGGAGGCVRWDFDISEAEGVGGEWRMWSRLINPSNHSDYMLIEGDPDDLEIPQEEPYPGGDGAPPFNNGDDRVFEETSTLWEWEESGEGHTKQLHDGLNSMYLFHRQGTAARELDIIMWTDDLTYTPTDEDYLNATVVDAPECTDPGDTVCLNIEVNPQAGGDLVAGFYTITVEAEDDGGDLVLYEITADNGIDPPIVERTSGESGLPVEVTFLLQPGTWTISATVDDDILCDDADAENVCAHDPIEVAEREIVQADPPDTPFKVSDYNGSVQIWFEAEHFQERVPDDDTFFPVVFAEGAFGDDEEAVTRAGGAGGCIRWDFDIEAAGGVAGEWYLWARAINPNNRSDYMLVLGDPGDFEIPDEEPYPGGNGTPPFVDADDRTFEPTIADWGWIGGQTQGHIKELLDGVNSMFVFHREGNETRLLDVLMWTDDPTYVPTDEDYENAFEGGGDPPTQRPKFHRGDTDGDGTINIADAVSMLGFLFGGGADTTCKETQDFDNDGNVVITDAVAILLFLFSGGADPAPPGGVDQPCGEDPDAEGSPGDLGCVAYTNC